MPTIHSNAFQLFLAAWVSLVIAVLLGLHSPFWAAMPVWVVSQAYRQDLVIRGSLRVLGTLMGAGLGYAILSFVPNPYVIAGLMALVVGLSAGTTFWIGTIYSYGVLITGITTAVIVVPLFLEGPEVMQYAVDRFWCTLIGVITVTLVTWAFTPERQEARPVSLDRKRVAPASRRAALCFGLSVTSGLLLAAAPSIATMSACLALSIFSSVLASMADPRPFMKMMPIGVSLGVVGAMSYRAVFYWLEPGLAVHLALAAGFILIGAYLRSYPRTAILAVDFNMCFLLAGEIGHEVHGLQQIALGGCVMGASAFLAAQCYRLISSQPQPKPQT